MKKDDLKDLLEIAVRFSRNAADASELESGALLRLGRSLQGNPTEFLDAFQTLVAAGTSRKALADILDKSHLKMGFSLLREPLAAIISETKSLVYFTQVMRVVGDYFGWAVTHYYFSGEDMPVKFSQSQLIITRFLNMVSLGLPDEVNGLTDLIEEADEDEESVLSEALTVAVKECIDLLPKTKGMIPILEKLRAVVKLPDAVQRELIVQYVENSSVRRRSGLQEVLIELQEADDVFGPKTFALVIAHLAQETVSNDANIVGISKSMIGEDLDPIFLANYLKSLESIPENFGDVAIMLRKIRDPDRLAEYQDILGEYADYSDGEIDANPLESQDTESTMEESQVVRGKRGDMKSTHKNDDYGGRSASSKGNIVGRTLAKLFRRKSKQIDWQPLQAEENDSLTAYEIKVV